jgi:hypothetical protein
MEYLTIFEAAKQAGVSDKTLRRAIENGTLVAQPRLYSNQPVMIAIADWESYLTSRHIQERRLDRKVSRHVETSDRARIAELERRVEELERLVGVSTPVQQKKGPRRKIEPVELWPFVTRHMVGYDEKLEEKVRFVAEKLRPFKREDGVEMLDAQGQRAFWEIFHHTTPLWQDCPDCPHEA